MSIKGKKILNTRPANLSGEFTLLLESCGASVIDVPMMEIRRLPDYSELEKKLNSLDTYDGLIFTSSSAAKFFFEILEQRNIRYRGRIFSVGEKTARAVKHVGYQAVFFSGDSGSENLIKALSADEFRNSRFLHPKGDIALDDIKRSIKNVDEVTVYSNVKTPELANLDEVKRSLESNEINCIAFFSPSAVRNFLEFVPGFRQNGIRIAAIGKTTEKFAVSCGLRVDILPESQTAGSLCEAIKDFYNRKSQAISGFHPYEKGVGGEAIFIKACFSEPTERTPVWIMRQAGRYLPEYRAIREKYDFMTMCRTPELASEVTLQPVKRFGFDAAIIFSDILVIPDAMGMKVKIIESQGPAFDKPIESSKDIEKLNLEGINERLKYVFDAVSLTRDRLNTSVPLIGFAGSPWTLAVYMLEGGGSRNFEKAKAFIRNHPADAHSLLQKLSDAVSNYLKQKISAGCSAVQIFDTWAGILSLEDFEDYSLRYLKQVADNVRTERVPVIVFAKGISDVVKLANLNCDVLGIDWTLDLGSVRARVKGKALQGNLNPDVLLTNAKTIRFEAGKVLESYGKGNGHIFNLGHGILPSTPIENVKILVDFIKEESYKYHEESH